jgi:hypothetical protein
MEDVQDSARHAIQRGGKIVIQFDYLSQESFDLTNAWFDRLQ